MTQKTESMYVQHRLIFPKHFQAGVHCIRGCGAHQIQMDVAEQTSISVLVGKIVTHTNSTEKGKKRKEKKQEVFPKFNRKSENTNEYFKPS